IGLGGGGELVAPHQLVGLEVFGLGAVEGVPGEAIGLGGKRLLPARDGRASGFGEIGLQWAELLFLVAFALGVLDRGQLGRARLVEQADRPVVVGPFERLHAVAFLFVRRGHAARSEEARGDLLRRALGARQASPRLVRVPARLRRWRRRRTSGGPAGAVADSG